MKKVSDITLNFIKDIATRGTRSIEYKGLSVLIEPNVFPIDSPFSYSSEITAKHIPVDMLSVLDIGTGTGIQALVAAQRGTRKVVAIDIDNNALHNAEKNAVLNNFQNVIEVRKSNLFDNIGQGEKFNLIIAQLPFANSIAGTDVDHLLFDPNFLLHNRFFQSVHNYLHKDGIIIIPSADFADDETLARLIQESPLSIKNIFEEEKHGARWKTYILG